MGLTSKDKYKYDCIHFKGYKPCALKKLCPSCDSYAPRSQKILIIKLGALGDVLRTTPILTAFKRRDPHCHITWVTRNNAKDMLGSLSEINRLISVEEGDGGAALRLMVEEFDEMHCYDKDDAAISLATLSKAKKKFGFFMNPEGHMAPINELSEYSFDLGLSDPLKFEKNQKTYQQLTYETSGLAVPVPMDGYVLSLTEKDKRRATEVVDSLGWSSSAPIIGLNTGSGRVFRTKQWLEESFIDLARLLHDRLGVQIMLLGGKDEHEKNLRIAGILGSKVTYPGCNFTVREFAALVAKCKAVVTGDTLAMHLALSVGSKVAVLFGSTCEQEVDLYGRGEKIISKPKCAPCYKNECDQPDNMRCMKDISPLRVFESVRNLL